MILTSKNWHLYLLPVAILLLASCASAQGKSGSPTPSPSALAQGISRSAPLGSEGTMIMAVSDIALGRNRLAFAILDKANQVITVPQATVRVFPLNSPDRALEGQAIYRGEGLYNRGVYVTEVELNATGQWVIQASVSASGQKEATTVAASFQVSPKSATPSIGDKVPLSRNKTSKGGAVLETITSDRAPDPELYRLTIADAVAEGKPFLVVFATPAFCTSQTCGPVVDIVKELKKKTGNRLNFIHVEIFDNLEDLSKGSRDFKLSPAVAEWNLLSEPWVFVVDSQGRLALKFEGPTTLAELEDAVQSLLQKGG